MSGRRGWLSVLAVAVLACARPGAEGGRGSTGASLQLQPVDSLVGVVDEVGADPATRLVLTRPGEGQRPVIGDSARPLRSVIGAEVLVRGRSADEFVVSAFTVRSVNGVPVDDGMVGRASSSGPAGTGGTLELIMRDGARRPLSSLFDGVVGQRVWVTRAEPGRAPSFGVIR